MTVINDDELRRLTPAGESDEEMLNFIEEMTTKCKEVQQQVLTEILTQNGETEYLRRHGLGGATDRAAFKSKIQVVTYEDLLPDIMRIANGDASAVLSGHPITELLTSSGTSGGERKLIPTIEQDANRRLLFSKLYMLIIKQYVQGLDEGKCLRFMFIKAETQTPGGLPARMVTTSFYKSIYERFRSPGSLDKNCSPAAAILCPDTHQSMYIQMLCGLIHRLEVNEISTTFASGLVHAIHFLETNWSQLARDIATGTLSSFISDPSLRASVADLLHPDLDLSSLITEECSKPSWAGIISRIWPNTKFLQTVVTGTMAQYIPALEFYGGGLPIASMSYASSECFSAINLTPICPPSEVSYTIMPNMGYFEFLAEGSEKLDPVDLADVEVGKEYELVVTTYGGLYRYRVGDVLKVSGFFNATPQLKFVRRKNVLLSIDTDKTDEVELHRAVTAAVELLSVAAGNVSLVDYTSHTCTTTAPGHYVIYWELLWRGKRLPEFAEVMERCCLAMEEELNTVYRQNRVAVGSIGPLEIRVVRAGTFEKMMELVVSKGTTISQYKVARCMSFKPSLELLDSNVLSAHFSPSLPRWSPRLSFQSNVDSNLDGVK